MATVDKSDTNTHDNKINLKVLAEDYFTIYFKMKKGTLMKNLMKSFCERSGLEMATTRFLIDGLIIREADTPLSLELEEGDIIQVFQQRPCRWSKH